MSQRNSYFLFLVLRNQIKTNQKIRKKAYLKLNLGLNGYDQNSKLFYYYYYYSVEEIFNREKYFTLNCIPERQFVPSKYNPFSRCSFYFLYE